MHRNPLSEVRGVSQVKPQRRQVQPTLLRLGVVALKAMPLDKVADYRDFARLHRGGQGEQQKEPDESFHALGDDGALSNSIPRSVPSQCQDDGMFLLTFTEATRFTMEN